MTIALVAGTASGDLARAIGRQLGIALTQRRIERFPDGEIGVEIGPVRGADVYLIQGTSPPVHDNLIELLMLADAARRAGASSVAGVIPYVAYARHDRRDAEGQSLGGRVVASVLSAVVDRVIAVDLHIASLEGFFGCPVEHLSALPSIAKHVGPNVEGRVVVAPDTGAIKRATHFARLLGLDVAGVRKRRLSGTEVEALGVDGDVRSREVVIVDDMISTGATIVAAAEALRRAGARRVGAIATHALLVGDAVERLAALELDPFVVSDSVTPGPVPGISLSFVGISPLLGDAIARLESHAALAELISAP